MIIPKGWPEVQETALQEWLNTRSPDYLMLRRDSRELIVDRRRGDLLAFMDVDGRCFVHPDFRSQIV